MGKEGDHLDTFIAQLNPNLAACKMETFNWTDFAVLVFNKNIKVKQQERRKACRAFK